MKRNHRGAEKSIEMPNDLLAACHRKIGAFRGFDALFSVSAAQRGCGLFPSLNGWSDVK